MKSRILVVDDNLINQKVLIGMVKKLGYEGVGVDNGKEAINKLKTEKLNLVFMDCHMPDMDGFSTTRKIREMEKGTSTHIPIVAITADAMKGTREKCIHSGMDDYLSKPVDITALRDCITGFLDKTD